MSGLPTIVRRAVEAPALERLLAAGCHPLLARVYAARGITGPDELDDAYERLHAPATMRNIAAMAACLAESIAARARLVIVADYDADGATACAVALRALRGFAADVHYIVPNRFEHGYGLTPALVQQAYERFRPDVLVTVDNGIASFEGVAHATALGVKTLVTDHHLPADRLPAAWCIVNPNQPGCAFASKHLAGVGVIFYVMLALRAELRRRGALEREPPLASLLDLVALGTVADVVRLDANNRLLVERGLKRIRAGRMQPGIAALFAAAGRDPARASAHDLGFALGPRLNAAGRLDDMALGIECLATDDPARAAAIAQALDRLNRERRAIEAQMHDTALAAMPAQPDDACALSLFEASWHPGVVGILAARVRERMHRPVIAFARMGAHGDLRGSGRSIPGLHLRDALDLIAKRHPGLVRGFGGHAAAAGVVIRESDLGVFRAAFDDTVRGLVTASDLQRQIETDGSLEPAFASYECAARIAEAVWGQGFPEPRFIDVFDVLDQRTAGGAHSRLKLRRAERNYDAMLFHACEPLPGRLAAVYRLDVNDYGGTRGLRLILDHWRSPSELPL